MLIVTFTKHNQKIIRHAILIKANNQPWAQKWVRLVLSVRHLYTQVQLRRMHQVNRETLSVFRPGKRRAEAWCRNPVLSFLLRCQSAVHEDLHAALFEVHSLPTNKQGVKDIDHLAADAVGVLLGLSLVLGGIIQDISKQSRAWCCYKLSHSPEQSTATP